MRDLLDRCGSAWESNIFFFFFFLLLPKLLFFIRKVLIFFLTFPWKHMLWYHWKCLIEVLLMRIHNICFHGWILKIFCKYPTPYLELWVQYEIKPLRKLIQSASSWIHFVFYFRYGNGKIIAQCQEKRKINTLHARPVSAEDTIKYFLFFYF